MGEKKNKKTKKHKIIKTHLPYYSFTMYILINSTIRPNDRMHGMQLTRAEIHSINGASLG